MMTKADQSGVLRRTRLCFAFGWQLPISVLAGTLGGMLWIAATILATMTLSDTAFAQGSTVTLDSIQGPAGTRVTGTGTNWQPGDHMWLSWDGGVIPVGKTTVNNDGTFSVSFNVPFTATSGDHTIYFTDVDSHYFLVGTFTVTQSGPPCEAFQFFFARGTNELLTDIEHYGFGTTGASTWDEYITHLPPPGGAAAFPVDYKNFIFPPPGVLSANPEDLINAIRNQAANPLGLNAAVSVLRNQLSQAALDCPDSKFVLVGYSYGAWVIQRYLHLPVGDTDLEVRNLVEAVLLYGDPTWPERPEFAPRLGLATWIGLGIGLGYSDAEYLPTTVPNDRFGSLCLSYDLNTPTVNTPYTAYDPVCLYNPSDPLPDWLVPGSSQNNLSNCFGPESVRPPEIQCPHRQYHLLGATKRGADWLAAITGANSCPGPGCAR